jgi:hypothetical protein
MHRASTSPGKSLAESEWSANSIVSSKRSFFQRLQSGLSDEVLSVCDCIAPMALKSDMGRRAELEAKEIISAFEERKKYKAMSA